MRFIKSIFWVVLSLGSLFAITGAIADRIRSVPNLEHAENAKPFLRIADGLVVFSLSLFWNNPLELVFIILVLASMHYLWLTHGVDDQKQDFDDRRKTAQDRERSKKAEAKRRKAKGG